MDESDLTEKKSFPVWLIIVVVVILLSALGALGWWLYKNQSQNSASTSSVGDQNAATGGWQTYKSASQGFSIIIPPNWKQTESGVEGRVSFSSGDAPEGDAPPTYPVTFANIWSEANSENLTAQGVIDALKSNIQKSAVKDFKIELEEDVTINGVQGRKIVMSDSDLQTQLSHVSGFACAVKNGKVYNINFVATAKDAAAAKKTWNENSYLFDKMISAFIFL